MGAVAPSPNLSDDYRRGYLAGLSAKIEAGDLIWMHKADFEREIAEARLEGSDVALQKLLDLDPPWKYGEPVVLRAQIAFMLADIRGIEELKEVE